MSSNRMTPEEARRRFEERPDFWSGGEFKPQIDFELDEIVVGTIIAKYAMKGVAGIFQFYGPFNPLLGPLQAKFFPRADSELQLLAEGVGTRFFLEYTPEAATEDSGTYFLAFDFTNRTLISEEEITRIARNCAHQLMSRWQQIERDAHRARLEASGRTHASQRRQHGT